MNIVVLIKQVPNTNKVNIDKKTGNLLRDEVDGIINPNDLHAIEASLVLKDLYNAKITAITMGPKKSINALSEVMGMGIDNGILLTDSAFSGADTLATSFTLGKAIKKIRDYDIVLCGRQAIDGDTGQVGPQVAAFLGIPQVTYALRIELINSKKIKIMRKTDEGFDILESKFPLLISVMDFINKPRYPILSRLISSCHNSSNISVWNSADIGVKVSEVGFRGSMTQVIKTSLPKYDRNTKLLKGNTSDLVNVIFNKMKKSNFI